jgi:AcrR family transcriptional regulator
MSRPSGKPAARSKSRPRPLTRSPPRAATAAKAAAKTATPRKAGASTAAKTASKALAATTAKGRLGRRPGATLGREAVLRAVCGLLRDYSYSQVTISAVARKLRVDPALIRYYFRDHATLMGAAGEALKEEFRACALAAVARSDGTPEGLLRGRISALLQIGTRYRFAVRLLVDLSLHNRKPQVLKSMHGLISEGVQFYERLFTAGEARGELRRLEPTFMTMAVLAMADVFTIQEPMFRASRRLGLGSASALQARYQEFLVDLIFNGVKVR